MGYHLPGSYFISLPFEGEVCWVLFCMNDCGWPCWPSIGFIGKKAKVPRRTLQRHLNMLRQVGFLKSSGKGKALTWELVNVPAEMTRKVQVEVRHRGTDRRRGGTSPVPPRRTRCATVAQGSEPENEPEKEPRRLRPQQLEELRATPAESDAPGTRYESLAEAIRQRLGAGVPLPGPGGTHPGPAPNNQDAAEAWRRLKLLKAGRLTA